MSDLRLPTSTNMTIFVLFFAMSLIDAFVTRDWWRAGFWMLIALVFLGANRFRRASADDEIRL